MEEEGMEEGEDMGGGGFDVYFECGHIREDIFSASRTSFSKRWLTCCPTCLDPTAR